MPRHKLRKDRLFWTRSLELKLVEFVKQRECIWKPADNTNHNIELKYKAYAEFASLIGGDFTARAVRDRWVNIRSTYNHNYRKVEQTKKTAVTDKEIYVPSWPLWKPCQFLNNTKLIKCSKKELKDQDESIENNQTVFLEGDNFEQLVSNTDLIEEFNGLGQESTIDDITSIRQRTPRTSRPKHRRKRDADITTKKSRKKNKSGCSRVLDNLVRAIKPLSNQLTQPSEQENIDYWFFGRHVAERLSTMRSYDAHCASQKIMELLNRLPTSKDVISNGVMKIES